MKKELQVLIFSMINNFIISLLKIIGGIFSSSNSLFSDGLHTFSDFITDIFAYIGSKFSKKHPNKLHPFGYGKVEYITSLFIGVVILALGIFIIVKSFFTEFSTPSYIAIVISIVSVILKFFSVIYLMKMGKKLKSQILLASGKESLTDLYSSTGVIIIIILSNFSNVFPILKYSDLVGSLIIGFLILTMAYNILKENIFLLIGEVSNDSAILKRIEDSIESIPSVDLEDIKLIKYGSYYKASLVVEINPELTIMQLARLEKKINVKVKKEKVGIKYLTIEVKPDLDGENK